MVVESKLLEVALPNKLGYLIIPHLMSLKSEKICRKKDRLVIDFYRIPEMPKIKTFLGEQ